MTCTPRLLVAMVTASLWSATAIAQESYESIHKEASQKWAEFLGIADACSYSNRQDRIAAEAEKAAATLHPGIVAWITGEQAEAAKSLTVSWTLTYTVAKLNPSCLQADFLEQTWYRLMNEALDKIDRREN
ncbi:hypothetical protein QKW60_05700 [Defluviimonas aestuarii]|uniref:hypothetical protein n=1 Tax=Albidovulum aestuarii TaxID=1130726 RepID=UPI00249CD8F8|nr:hypothetical protein [Defluviimonas aestuarii]MDI3335891.1 hypothetical protein [Defluviimonas aestuarii]